MWTDMTIYLRTVPKVPKVTKVITRSPSRKGGDFYDGVITFYFNYLAVRFNFHIVTVVSYFGDRRRIRPVWRDSLLSKPVSPPFGTGYSTTYVNVFDKIRTHFKESC